MISRLLGVPASVFPIYPNALLRPHSWVLFFQPARNLHLCHHRTFGAHLEITRWYFRVRDLLVNRSRHHCVAHCGATLDSVHHMIHFLLVLGAQMPFSRTLQWLHVSRISPESQHFKMALRTQAWIRFARNFQQAPRQQLRHQHQQ